MLPVVETVDEAPVAGEPCWIAPTMHVTSGRDPLGWQTISIDRIMPELVPGILALSQRARYFSFHAFLLDEYRWRQLSPSNDALSAYIKTREYDLGLATELCPYGCGSRSSGVVGKQRVGPAARGSDSTTAFGRRESVDSDLGGYGLYYRTPLIDLGLVAPKNTPMGEHVTPVDTLIGEAGQALAEEYRRAIAHTTYYRRYMYSDEPIPRPVLEEYAEHACLCRLPTYPRELALLRMVLLDNPAPSPKECIRRRRSFALFLEMLSAHPELEGDMDFYAAIWAASAAKHTASEARESTLAAWAALVAKEYLQEGISLIWARLCQHGLASQPADGFTAAGLSTLLTDGLLDAHEIGLSANGILLSAAMPTVEFAASLRTAIDGIPLPELVARATGLGSASAGLALLLLLADHLPRQAHTDWTVIGRARSEHQPGLLGFYEALASHLDQGPRLGETMAWIARRYVLDAHQRIAYSKLPEFTFRFRWDGGRLRFYPLSQDRFVPRGSRYDAMRWISQDLGLWHIDGKRRPTLTEQGVRFVAEVFA